MRIKSLLVLYFLCGFCLYTACIDTAPNNDVSLADFDTSHDLELLNLEPFSNNAAKPTPILAQPFPPAKKPEPADELSLADMIALSSFNPYEPEGWQDDSVYYSYDENELEWINADKKITTADSHINKFNLGMKWSSAVPHFPSKSYEENEWSDDYFSTKILVFDTLVLEFTQGIYDNISLALSSIYICGGTYITPRGLAVGDSVDKLFELYGTPACVFDSVWHYYNDHGDDLFQAMVIDNVVEKIHINQIL